MHIAGLFLVIIICGGGFTLAQAFFFHHTGRAFWRAMIPSGLRFTIVPNDKVELDSFMVLEEWAALLFLGSFILLPLLALNVIGFISFF